MPTLLLVQPVSACHTSVTFVTCPRASLTSQQPLGDAKGTHQVLGEIQVGRLLAQLREALGQSRAPQPVLPRAQRHIQQTAWGDRAGVRELHGSECPVLTSIKVPGMWTDPQTPSPRTKTKGPDLPKQTPNRGPSSGYTMQRGRGSGRTSPSRMLEVWGHSGCNVWADRIG